MSGPTDVVIGINSEGENLSDSAVFMCTAIGLPAPTIEWFYSTISLNGDLGEARPLRRKQILNMTESDPEEDTTGSGRMIITSRLTISVSEKDGGIIRCKAGSSYKDATLTVLGNTVHSIR